MDASDRLRQGLARLDLPGVARACAVFELTAFERDVVLLALAVEVDAACSVACAELLGEPARRPTVELALRLIWERHLVREHLAADVDLGMLANRFAIAGGDIRNAVIAALLLAADDGGTVAMRHLVIGLWRELNKAGRLVSPDEFGAWSQHVLAYVRAGQTR